MSEIEVIVGGMFGSEAKGHVAAWRAKQARMAGKPTVAVRVAGPNAGHTVIGDKGVDTSGTVAPNLCEPVAPYDGARGWPNAGGDSRYAWRLRQVPVAAVVDLEASLLIAAGSEIDPEVLINEVICLDRAGYDVSSRLMVDERVTVIHDRHKVAETHPIDVATGIARVHTLTNRIGSTGKGVGAARADRLWRVPEVCLTNNPDTIRRLRETGIGLSDTAEVIHGFLRTTISGVVQVEGTQGYGLGSHTEYYPFGTASDCRAIDFLAMAGISPWQAAARRGSNPDGDYVYQAPPELTVWVCIRPYPIRVGGNSGPLHEETTWEALGLPVEHTTVTGKVRRVGGWDRDLVRGAIRANGGPADNVKVALMMFDQVMPEVAGWCGQFPDQIDRSSPELEAIVERTMKQAEWYSTECDSPIAVLGTGPDTVLALGQ